ncbi:MAG: GNAT family N-acetyltransferase, partial [Gammaproteobacteria bacterium]|nr:GNAT family N-acetyltransferase [Gammaproteobacteria bacterium]
FRRALSLMRDSKAVYFIEQDKPLPEINYPVGNQKASIKADGLFRTVDQQRVVDAIVQGVFHNQQLPIVLISDRGRGKSSALGLAAGVLISQGLKNIIVTAPRLSVSEPVFYHSNRIIDDANLSRGKLTWQDGLIKFIAPDALLNNRPEADLLIVDEAAAIPLNMLEQFLHSYPSIVFATTIHGYEGTGRGFALKFNKILDQFSPGWKQFNMNTPVRWAEDDPVEQWIDKMLCLDAELSVVSDMNSIVTTDCDFKLLNRDELLSNENKLSSISALLVSAHYRTQPSDIKHMLDDPEVRLYTLEYQQSVIAVALMNQEGGFDQVLSAEIYRGERRPQGHLLAQTLTLHAGCEQAATLKYARIMRIAVHPQLQHQGFGTFLIKNVIEQEKLFVDAIGTSFGASAELIRFWKKVKLEMVRIGFTQDHASASHSAVMLMPFTDKGEQIFELLRNKFQRYLYTWLSGPLKQLSAEVREIIEQDIINDTNELTEQDYNDIRSFAYTHRGYETCMWPLKKYLSKYSYLLDQLNDTEKNLVQAKIEQDLDWQQVVAMTVISGRSGAIEKLRHVIAKMMALSDA